MLTYATVEQLAEYVSAAGLDTLADGDDVRYIEAASRLVRGATKCDLYDTTPPGIPSDPVLADAMTAATCIQVRAWITAGINPLGGVAAVPAAVASASVNGASLSYDIAAQSAARVAMVGALVDDARDALRAVGLASAKADRW